MEWRRSLYDDDVCAWAEEQAQALRRLAETRRDLPNDLDLENIAEEIEDVGIAQRNAAESYIRQIFVHLIKLASAPESPAAKHWRGEIVGFHSELLQRLTPSMSKRIDLDKVWARAAKEAEARLGSHGEVDGGQFAKLRGVPLTFDELATDDFDLDAALAALANSAAPAD